MIDLVPIRWPLGAEWLTPAALAVLENTPFNYLVVPKEVPQAFIASAKARGLTAATEPPAAIIADPVWPGVQRSLRGSSTSDAGPTGPPWADANGWAVLLARAKHPGKPVWVPAEPPTDRVLRPEHYALAVADAEAYGGRWVASLQPDMWKGLLSGQAQARECWATIVQSLRFFSERRAAIESLAPLTRLGIISTFENEDEFLGHEVLNLAARRYMSYRVILRPKLHLEGLSTALWLYEKAPEGEEKKALTAFVQSGGTLVIPNTAAQMTAGLQQAGTSEPGYPLFRSGKGRIAVAPEAWGDPYVVAADVNRIMTRRGDTFRLWNPGASNAWVQTGNGRTLAHIVNFTARHIGHPMSLWVARRAKSAKFSDLFGRSEILTPTPKGEGAEVNLPAFSSYAWIDFGETA